MGRLPRIPYDEIDRRGDRSWTLRLVDRVREPAASERDRWKAARTLRELADPRMVAPLRALLLDRAAAEEMREAAAEALLDVDVDELPPAILREWWERGDEILRRAALDRMDDRCGDVLAAVASDPEHPLYLDAITSLAFGCDGPRYQPLKVAALHHPDVDVRIKAADVLVWDEPLIALEPLLAALRDRSWRVAEAAADTLRYYPAQRTLRALAPLCSSPHAKLRETAAEVFSELRADFILFTRLAPGLKVWMEPVWDLLAPAPEELEPLPLLPPRDPLRAPRERASAAEIRERFDDLDGAWREKESWFRFIDFEAFDAADRASLSGYLAAHPDPGVRQLGCLALSPWSARDHLLELLDDPDRSVKKSATYYLGEMPSRPDPLVAARAWRRLDEPGLWSTPAYEALHTYDQHATDPEVVPNLLLRAREHPQEDVRTHAIYALTRRDAADAIRDLLPLLARPPAVTWAVHIALLSACKHLSLAPPPEALAILREVDDLYIQRGLASLDPH